jgi:hypothetical protein
VEIETHAAFVQGIFGIGGENRGEIKVVVSSRDEEITEDMITAELKGKIVIGGSFISLSAYKKAIEHNVAGIVVGGFNYHDLKVVLGYTLGVAITGSEDLTTSLVLTEGFGKIGMGLRSFDLLKACQGRFASVNGATQIRAGVIRPEIVIPTSETKSDMDRTIVSQGIQNGSLVRIIRAPHFGKMGQVADLPPQLHEMESETKVRVAVVEVDKEKLTVPRSNLEIVETD